MPVILVHTKLTGPTGQVEKLRLGSLRRLMAELGLEPRLFWEISRLSPEWGGPEQERGKMKTRMTMTVLLSAQVVGAT